MKKLFLTTALIASVATVDSFAVSSPSFAQDSAVEAIVAESEETRREEGDAIYLSKTLAEGVVVNITKKGQEPAVAKIDIPGAESVSIDASFDAIDEAPESAREYLRGAWERLGETPKKRINVEIDTTAAPDAQKWAERAKRRVEYWYPRVVEMLDGEEGLANIPDDFKIRLVFKPMDGVAYAAGREITVSSRYIKARPDDFGLVIHETTHVAQAYPRVREVWAMEGMTDWIRYFVTEPRSRNSWRVNTERSKYTDSYGVTATFFEWLVENKDPEFIKKIHKVFRSRQSVEKFVVEEYGKTCQELWDEFIASQEEKR